MPGRRKSSKKEPEPEQESEEEFQNEQEDQSEEPQQFDENINNNNNNNEEEEDNYNNNNDKDDNEVLDNNNDEDEDEGEGEDEAQPAQPFNANEETPILKRAKTEKEDESNETPSGVSQTEPAKADENKQTRVLFIRGIPYNTTEQDISNIVNPFGQITDSLLLLKQNTAFIELENEEVAQKVLNYFSSIQPTLKGQPIQFLTSNRDKIEHKAKSERTDTKEEKSPLREILITISNKIYPIGIDVLQEVFQRCGTVHKIVTFTSKTGGFQAFIQYSNVSEAQEAVKTLDNQNIYSNCCTLSIQYSDLDDVNVRYNNEKTRDFTNPDLPTTAPPSAAPRSSNDSGRGGFGNPTFRNQSAQFNNNNSNNNNNNGSGNPNYRGGMQGGSFNQGSFNQGSNFNQGSSFNQGSNFSQGGSFNQSGFNQGGFNQANQSFNSQGFNFNNPNTGYPAQGANTYNQSTVLHVTHLNPQECTLDVLFTLFGVYGDVQRVKIMFNKQDNALIQMASHEQCLNAIKYLNSVNLYGTQIHVSLSRNSYVSMPKQITAETEKYTKDYSNSTAHRYKGTGSKQYQHICAPSNSLHISNLAESTTEDQIKTVFAGYGTVSKVNLFTPPNTQVHMGVVEMATQEQAIDALIKLHNTNVNNQVLRVTFSQPKKRKMPNSGAPNQMMQPNNNNMAFNNSATFNPYSQ